MGVGCVSGMEDVSEGMVVAHAEALAGGRRGKRAMRERSRKGGSKKVSKEKEKRRKDEKEKKR